MSVKVDGRVNLLSGHYKDIIIAENRQGNFLIKTRPNEEYCVKKLDDSYPHFEYRKIEDLDRIRKIIEYYLNNNTIFMLTSKGKLKNHSGHFQGLNAYNTFLDGYRSLSNGARALYFRIVNREFEDIMVKIIKKYHEDRIRHLDKIVDSKEIIIDIAFNETSYYIDDDEAIITVQARCLDDEITIYKTEEMFLKKILLEFIKKYGYKYCISKDCYHTELYSKYDNKSITLDDRLFPYVLEADREFYKMSQDYDNITIDDYLLELKGNDESPKIKIKN